MRLIIALLTASTLVLSSCGESQPSSSESVEVKSDVNANASVDLKIEGMVCEKNCAGSIEKEVSKMEGVASCEVDFENKVATIKFDDSKIEESAIREKVESINDGAYKIIIEEIEENEEGLDEEAETAVEALNAVSMSAGNLMKIKNVVELLSSLIK